MYICTHARRTFLAVHTCVVIKSNTSREFSGCTVHVADVDVPYMYCTCTCMLGSTWTSYSIQSSCRALDLSFKIPTRHKTACWQILNQSLSCGITLNICEHWRWVCLVFTCLPIKHAYIHGFMMLMRCLCTEWTDQPTRHVGKLTKLITALKICVNKNLNYESPELKFECRFGCIKKRWKYCMNLIKSALYEFN